MLLKSLHIRLRVYRFLCMCYGWFDAIVFTAGIGENNDVMRSMICDGLEF